MNWTKCIWGMAVVLMVFGMVTQAVAACPSGFSMALISSESWSSVPTICVATSDPDSSGKCESGKTLISGYQCIKPTDGTVVVGHTDLCLDGEVIQGLGKCAATATPALTCSSGHVGIATSAGNLCVDSANLLKTPTCQVSTPAIPMIDPKTDGNCPDNYMLFYAMSCAVPGSGVAADPSAAKTYCACPAGQTYQTIKKCSSMPLVCPAGQGSVLILTSHNTSWSQLGQKCIPVTNSGANGNCPEGKIVVTASVITDEANPLTATLTTQKMCVAGSIPNPGSNCPVGTLPGDGVCIAIPDNSLASTASPEGTAKMAASPASQSGSGGGGSCSLIR